MMLTVWWEPRMISRTTSGTAQCSPNLAFQGRWVFVLLGLLAVVSSWASMLSDNDGWHGNDQGADEGPVGGPLTGRRVPTGATEIESFAGRIDSTEPARQTLLGMGCVEGRMWPTGRAAGDAPRAAPNSSQCSHGGDRTGATSSSLATGLRCAAPHDYASRCLSSTAAAVNSTAAQAMRVRPACHGSVIQSLLAVGAARSTQLCSVG